MNFLKIIAGAAEVALGALIAVGTLGGGAYAAGLLMASGAGMMLSGIGSIIAGNPVRGFNTTTRNSISPWKVAYGSTRAGGTICELREKDGETKCR